METLRVSANQHFIETETGLPFFWLGDTAWELFHRLNREEANTYLDDRASKGFNVIQAVILAERDGLRTANASGELPLRDDDPLQPNEKYFQYVDEIIRLAASKDLYIGLLPTWGDKLDLVGGSGPVIFDAVNAYRYGEWLSRRYLNDPNIVWVLGGDRYAEGFEPVWRAMALGIRAGTQGAPLITYHPRGVGNSSASFHREDWLSFNMIQSGHGELNLPNWEWIAKDYALEPPKPTLDAEANYEYHPVGFDAQLRAGRFSDYDVRKSAYRSVLAGACGYTYGHHSIWQMYDHKHEGICNPGLTWQEALGAPGSGQMVHLRRLIESRPYFDRQPVTSPVSNAEDSTSTHVCASHDALGRYALVYLPTSGQTVHFAPDLLRTSRVRAWWYDPQSGDATAPVLHEFTEGATFTSPADGLDWVLVLDDATCNFPRPGDA